MIITINTEHLSVQDQEHLAEIRRLSAFIGSERSTEQIIGMALSSGLRYDAETLRIVAECLERREEA